MSELGSFWLSWASPYGYGFNWPAIKKMAAERLGPPPDRVPGVPYYGNPEWEHRCGMISSCRSMLAARHEGWIAATDLPDPYPPEPFMRDDEKP